MGVGSWAVVVVVWACWGSSTLVTWHSAGDVAVDGRWELGAHRWGCWRSSPSVTWQARPGHLLLSEGNGWVGGFTHLGCLTRGLVVVVVGGDRVLTAGSVGVHQQR